MTLPSINSSWVGNTVTITNNSGGTPSISSAFINSTLTATLSSGSFSISNTNVNATTTINNTWSGSIVQLSNSQLLGTVIINTHTTASDTTGTRLLTTQNSIIGGGSITTFHKSGSSNSSGFQGSIILSNNFTVTGSAFTSGSSAIFGSWPVQDGRLNDIDQVRFAIGTGTGASARRTSLFVSASGLTVAQDSLLVTGSLTVGTTTPELTVLSTGVTLGNILSDVHTVTGSLSITGSLNAADITGSLFGTASFANNSTSASYSINADSASFAQTASFYGGSVVSASYALNSTSASYASTATSASFAVSASYAPSSFDANALYSYTFLLMGA
jgi:hypothetical protein